MTARYDRSAIVKLRAATLASPGVWIPLPIEQLAMADGFLPPLFGFDDPYPIYRIQNLRIVRMVPPQFQPRLDPGTNGGDGGDITPEQHE